ncbi:hypothetical protein COLO4_04015 [Corchorus olitorius]|uniref:Uncharacterized protein n=1 Tax=Corchorus olitorius TaxID=93759 RepID=A0A1R3KVN4_9ROSI|nr:hypothetical protein COLO4_04015 [Corchorus olitorius]
MVWNVPPLYTIQGSAPDRERRPPGVSRGDPG